MSYSIGSVVNSFTPFVLQKAKFPYGLDLIRLDVMEWNFVVVSILKLRDVLHEYFIYIFVEFTSSLTPHTQTHTGTLIRI